MNRGERWSWIVVTLLAFFLGLKWGQRSKDGEREHVVRHNSQEHNSQEELGARSSIPPLTPQPQPTPPLQCPPYEPCEPCDCQPKAPKILTKKIKRKRSIPPAAKMKPIERQRLLAWARQHGDRLKMCRDAGQPIYRLTASVELKSDARGIKNAKVKGENIPSKVIRCIEQDIRRWPPPKNLNAQRHPKLIFGLQLD